MENNLTISKSNNLKLIYEIAREKYNHLFEIVDAQEKKSATFISTIGIILAAIYFLYPKEANLVVWKYGFLVIVISAMILASVGLFYCIKALQIHSFSNDPDIAAVLKYYKFEEEEKTINQLIVHLNESLKENTKIVEYKAESLSRVARYILPLLLILTILSAVANFLYFL